MTAAPPLREALEDYLALRRALGFRLKTAGRLLDQFVSWLEDRGADTITAEDALTWAVVPPGASQAWQSIRLSTVRGFAAYLHGTDPSVQVPPPGLIRRGNDRATPYIYSDAEISAIIAAAGSAGKAPSRLDIADLDAQTVGAFLTHLENERGNSARTRNARLAAIHSLFGYAAVRHPEHAADIQRVLAIPPKRYDKALITYLTEDEITALLAAPDLDTWTGRRDRALLMLACQTGLRATELTSLAIGDVHLGTGAHASCLGKGRKQRITPLTPATVTVLRGWLDERGGLPADPLFTTRRGTPLSRDALERRIAKYTAIAAKTCPALLEKKISPHVMRHSAAMRLLNAGVDTSVIALWMGHENTATTQVYIHADLALKERAIARTAPQDTTPGRYQPSDDMLAFLDGL